MVSQHQAAHPAEGLGFEPREACTSTVFKTVAFDRSAIPPHFNKDSIEFAVSQGFAERFNSAIHYARLSGRGLPMTSLVDLSYAEDGT